MEGSNRLGQLLKNALNWLETPLERLVFLSSLRDPYTGRYLHEGWATVASPAEVHRFAKKTHMKVFREVGELGLWELCLGLQGHMKTLGISTSATAELWLNNEPFREMIPAEAGPIERELFISQIRCALGALRCCPDLFRPLERGALPHLPPDQPPPPHLEIEISLP